ncbi:MAG: hypothetical protein Tsb005_10940 [Gammaproteobacteria bacterium]
MEAKLLELGINKENIISIFWERLIRGVNSRTSEYHTFTFAYQVADHAAPRIGTMVLREVEPTYNRLFFHADNRSPKIQFIHQQPVGLLFYSRKDKLQFKLTGKAYCHIKDSVTNERWESMLDMSKRCYQQNKAPGEAIEMSERLHTLTKQQAYNNFCVVTVVIESIDMMYLEALNNQRFIVTYLADEVCIEQVAP